MVVFGFIGYFLLIVLICLMDLIVVLVFCYVWFIFLLILGVNVLGGYLSDFMFFRVVLFVLLGFYGMWCECIVG